MWGLIPAAGEGSRIQPLAFSKELLPVGSTYEGLIERPRAVSEYLVERMIEGGANKLCFIISPGKSDILEYYGGTFFEGPEGQGPVTMCYMVQPKPSGLCNAIFLASTIVSEFKEEAILIGLPDTIWFPENAYQFLPEDKLSLLLFPVNNPEYFDSVSFDGVENISRVHIKDKNTTSNWIWGGIKMPSKIFQELHELWLMRKSRDVYLGTLFNAYIENGGKLFGYKAGNSYVDVGTINGYRNALSLLSSQGGESLKCKRHLLGVNND